MKTSTKQITVIALSQEEKDLLGGSESLLIYNPNLSDEAARLFINSTNTSMKDEHIGQYDVTDGVISEFLNHSSEKISEDDLKIFKLIESRYQYLELKKENG